MVACLRGAFAAPAAAANRAAPAAAEAGAGAASVNVVAGERGYLRSGCFGEGSRCRAHEVGGKRRQRSFRPASAPRVVSRSGCEGRA